jgi:hypothetical protein
MRFDEAFDILVEYCAQASSRLAAATNEYAAEQARNNAFGADIWIAEVVRRHRWGRYGALSEDTAA